jgi:peptidylprolyl isomerase
LSAHSIARKLNPKLLNTPKKVAIHISIGGKKVKKPITLGLFMKETPKTAKNFIKICEGKFRSKYTGKTMHFAGTNFHRIIPKFMMQGGDFTNGDGTGGESIYGYKFKDENFKVKFAAGVIAMANAGPNTNGSQFFITFRQTSFLNGKHVVFGRVLDGMKTVKKVEKMGTMTGTPKKVVKFVSCEVL